MYIIKNAIRNVLRSKGRSLLIGILLFILMFSSCIALSIHQASLTSQNASEQLTNITGQIRVNQTKIMKDFDPSKQDSKEDMKEAIQQAKNLSLKQLKKYANSQYVSNFYYSATLTLQTSDSFNLLQNQQNFGPELENDNNSISIIGYQNDEAMTDFINGTSTLSKGTLFEEGTNENQCIISEDLATYNSVSIGDTIALKVNDSSTVNFVVTGFYSTTQNQQEPGQMNRSNQILTSYNVVKNLSKTYNLNLNVNGTYVFNTVADFKNFKKECKQKGLSSKYTVTSNDLMQYEQSITPLKNLSKFATTFLIVIFIIGTIVLIVLNLFSVRERKQEIGILCALGMKKSKIIIQFFTETLFITLFACLIGIGLGSFTSVPITNTLLASQIASTNSINEQKDKNFNREQAPNSSNEKKNTIPSQQENKGVTQITKVSQAVNLKVVFEVGCCAVLLVIISNASALLYITRYDPASILSNRD